MKSEFLGDDDEPIEIAHLMSNLAIAVCLPSAQHLHMRHLRVEVLRVSLLPKMFSSFWFSLILFLFLSFISSLPFFSVVGWRSVCPLGGLTGPCTFHGGRRGLQWVVSRNGDNWSDGDVNEGDRSRVGARAVDEVWLKVRVNLTRTDSSSGPTATWQ